MQKIKIIIVEDDKDWLKAMGCFFQDFEDIEVVGTANDRKEAIEEVISKDVDIVLMDINLKDRLGDGIHAVLDTLSVKKVKIIMLTSLKDNKSITDAYTAGAVDYVPKDDYRDLPFVIRRVFNRVVPAEVMLKEFHRLKREEQLKDLTPSEREIYRYIEKGYNKAQIGKLIYKAHSTIKLQVRSILKKLNVKSSREALKKVNSGGLTEDLETPD